MPNEVIEKPVDTPDAPEVEAPAEETAETPSVTFDESPPDTPAEEAPAEDDSKTLASEIAQLRQELSDLKNQKPQRTEAEIRADLEESTRRQQQFEEQSRQAEQSWKEELNESLNALLTTKGYYDVEPEAVRAIGERFINKRYDQIANREVAEVRNALTWLREGAEGQAHTVNLSPKAARHVSDMADSFNAIYGRLRERAVTGDEFIPKADLDTRVKAAVQADREARAAKSREGEEDIIRPRGGAGTQRTDAEILADPTTPVSVLREIRTRQRGS